MFGGDARDLRQPMAAGMPTGAGRRPPGMMPGQMASPPGQMAMPQIQIGANGMEMLSVLPAIDVEEQANMLQELTAVIGAEVEMANRYRVLDRAGNQLFYAVERTDCCRRQMQKGCCHDCASWEVDVLYSPPYQLYQQFITLNRPCGFTCCCINRPTANVIDATTQRKIGSFRDPWTCGKLLFQIRDAQDNHVLTVDGGCCCSQPGFICALPCGPCSEVAFDVKDVHTNSNVAKIVKKVPSAFAWCFAPDIDNYHVEFAEVETPEWKAMLLALTIFMDFRYFNTNRNQQEAQRVISENS